VFSFSFRGKPLVKKEYLDKTTLFFDSPMTGNAIFINNGFYLGVVINARRLFLKLGTTRCKKTVK
jgi:hypothetical protein